MVMRKIHFKWLLALLILLTGALLLAAPGWAVVEDSGVHNTILVLDGGASDADPAGLRFDAARLVYENLLAQRGELGAVIYSDGEYCEGFGPMALNADRAELDAAIGDHLSGTTGEGSGGGNIAAALRRVRDMLKDLDRRTATDVILLTPVSESENRRAIELAGKLREEGASIYVVALRLPGAADTSEFLRQLAGSGDNLFYSTAGDLDVTLLQTLILAESAPEVNQFISGTTPLEAKFTVPYADLNDAAVNLVFAPEDKARLGDIALVSPGGLRFDLWSNGAATAAEGIGVAEGRSYIMLDIPAPETGEWTVIATGDGAGLNVVPHLSHNLRLRLNLRSLFDAGETVLAEAWFQKYDDGGYEDLVDSDIYDQSQATLELYAPGADASGEPTLSVPMTYDGSGHWTASYDPEGLGIWTARAQVENDYLKAELKYNAFEVTDAPTPTPAPTPTTTPEPTPTPTPLPEVATLETFELSIDGLLTDSRGKNYVDGEQESFNVAWEIEGETDSVEAALMKDGKALITGLKSGDAIPTSALEPGHNYSFRVSVVPKNGLLAGRRPMVKSIGFKLAPAIGEIKGISIDVQPRTEGEEEVLIPRDAKSIEITWSVDGGVDSAKAELLEDGNVIRNNLRTGTLIQRSALKDGAAYTVRVSAVPENGELRGAEAKVEELSFRMFPEAVPIEGLALSLPGAELKKDAWRFEGSTAQLVWTMTAGEAERYILKVTDSKGTPVAAQGLDGDAKSYTVELPKNDDYTVELTAVPKNAQDDSMNAVATLTIRPHIKNFFEKYWYFLAGGLAALLAILAAVLLLLRRGKNKPKAKSTGKSGGKVKVDKKATYIVGTLHVYCEELELDAELKFDRPTKGGDSTAAAVKEGEPITAHPELAKLKGEEAHRLLNGVKLSMARADGSGNVAGEKKSPGHQPNAQVIGLTSLLPTGAKEVRYVGEYDIGEVTLRRKSPDGDYDFIFWGAARPKKPAAPEPEAPAEESPAAEPEAVEPEAPEAEKPLDLNALAEQVLAGSTRPRVSLAKRAPEPAPDADTAPAEAVEETPSEDLTDSQGTDDQSNDMASAYADTLNDSPDEEEQQTEEQTGGLASAYADMLNDFSDGEEQQTGGLASAYEDMLSGFTDEEEQQPEEASGDLASAYADMLSGFSGEGEQEPEESSSDLASTYADMLKGFSGEEEKQPEEPSSGLASAYADMLKGFSDEEEKEPEEPSSGLASAYADVLKGFSDEEEKQSEESSSGLASAYADFLNQHWDDEDEQKDE